MQEKPPFSSYSDFFSLTYGGGGGHPLPYPPPAYFDFALRHAPACLKRPLKKRQKNGFQDRLSLNAGQKYCRMLQESILQYFPPALSYHLYLRPLFYLFLSGRLRQVSLYMFTEEIVNLHDK